MQARDKLRGILYGFTARYDQRRRHQLEVLSVSGNVPLYLLRQIRARRDEPGVQHGKEGLATLGLAPCDAPRQSARRRVQCATAKHDRVLELDAETLLVQLTGPEAREGRMAQRSCWSIAAVS
jgi:hypothetical protein